jgi:hypothetical protein
MLKLTKEQFLDKFKANDYCLEVVRLGHKFVYYSPISKRCSYLEYAFWGDANTIEEAGKNAAKAIGDSWINPDNIGIDKCFLLEIIYTETESVKSDMNLPIDSIIITRHDGTDQISLEVNTCPTPFPELDKQAPGDYPAIFKLECRRGYAEKWLKEAGFEGHEVELITKTGKKTIKI